MDDLAIQSQVMLERLKSGFDREFAGTTTAMREQFAVLFGRLEVDRMDELSAGQLERLYIDAVSSNTTILRSGMSQFEGGLVGISDFAVTSELAMIRTITGTGPKFAQPTAAASYRAAFKEPLQATGQLLEGFISDWTLPEMQRIGGVIRQGWLNGETVASMSRRVRGTAALGFKDGELIATQRKASAVIHTATQHVASTGRMDFYERNSDIVTGYRWLSTLDRRTTSQCRSLDGRRFLPGKGPIPPIHINCRSTTVPVLSEEFGNFRKGGERASEKGPVANDLSYYDWLKRQPAEFQAQALGARRAQLFQRGGLSADEFARLNLSRQFEPLSLAEMRKMNPEAFRKAGLN